MTTTVHPQLDQPGTPPPTRGRSRWLAPLATTGAVIMLLAAAAYIVSKPGSGPSGTAAAVERGTSTSTPLAGPTGDSVAAAKLVGMADLITAVPSDSLRGQYVFVEVEHWSRSTGPDGSEIVPFHEWTWYGPGGSGRSVERRLPAQPARNFDPAQIGHTSFAAAPEHSTDFPTAEGDRLSSYVDGPLAADPERLLRQLEDSQGGGPLPPSQLIDAVLGIHQMRYLGRNTRASVMRIVGNTPGLVYDGDVTDRLGRPRFSVSLDTGGVRRTLVINRDTGELLASQTGVPGVVLDDYTLYVRRELRDAIG